MNFRDFKSSLLNWWMNVLNAFHIIFFQSNSNHNVTRAERRKKERDEKDSFIS